MFVRAEYQDVKARLEEPRMFIQVISGPRQVGKSTLVGQVLAGITLPFSSYSADNELNVTQAWISNVWDTVRNEMTVRHETEHILIIDEVQKIDNWSEVVKKEWDRDTREKRNIKVLLLGSSRLLLKKGLTESLAGRFELIRMGHWTYSEMRDAFGWTLDQYIYFGGYPGTAQLVANEIRWKNYVKDSLIESALANDVLGTTTVYKPALLKRLFELGCAYSGELLSLTKMMGQLQDKGNVTTLANYIQVLDECHLLAGLQKYSGDTARRYASVPKYQVYNNALMNVYSTGNFEQQRIDLEKWGRLVESAVGSHLLNYADKLDYKVYYWREKNNEVDFIIERNHKVWAIEVKSGKRGMNKGLGLFREAFNPYRAFVVGTDGISVEEFLSANLDDFFV